MARGERCGQKPCSCHQNRWVDEISVEAVKQRNRRNHEVQGVCFDGGVHGHLLRLLGQRLVRDPRAYLPQQRSEQDSLPTEVWDRYCGADGNFAVELSRNLNLACRIHSIGAFGTIERAIRSGIRSCGDSAGQAKNLVLINPPDMDRPLFCSNYWLFSEHMDVVQRLPERRGD
jgi:hypothetical protein